MENLRKIIDKNNSSLSRLEIPKSAYEYTQQKYRRASFKYWPFTNKNLCNPDNLAEAGFYYIGKSKSEDIVCCFVCQKTLDCWDPEDDPWKEHVSHASECPFAKLHQPEAEQTLMDFLTFRAKSLESFIEKEAEKRIEIIRNQVEMFKEAFKNL